MKKRYWFSLFVSFLILWFFFKGIDFHASYEVLLKADAGMLATAVFLVLIGLFLRIVRWQEFLNAYEIKSKFSISASTLMASTFLANITPAKFGDSSRPYFMKKRTNTPFFRLLPSIVIERFFDVLSLFIYAGLFLIFYSVFASPVIKATLFLFSFLFVIVLFILSSEKLFSKFVKAVFKAFSFIPNVKKHRKNISEFGKNFYSGMNSLGLKPTVFIFILSFFIWAAEALVLYYSALALGVQINVLYAFGFMALAVIIGTASTLPGGLGSSEAVLFSFFIIIGITAPVALSITVLYRFLSLGLSTLISSAFFLKECKK